MTNIKRITFSLSDRTQRALSLAVKQGEDNQTDTINRAVQVYAYLLHQVCGEGAAILVRKPDGTTETLNILL